MIELSNIFITGFPLQMFENTREQIKLGESQYLLKIFRARPNDSGNYKCLALSATPDENPVVVRDTNVFVRTPPTSIQLFDGPPYDRDATTHFILTENVPQEIHCVVNGSNTPAGAVLLVGNDQTKLHTSDCARNADQQDDCVFKYTPVAGDNGKNLTCKATHEILQRQNGLLVSSALLEVQCKFVCTKKTFRKLTK